MTDLESILDLLADRGPALRAAGYSKFSITPDGEISAELREADPPDVPMGARPGLDAALADAAARREHVPANPLDDPACYPGGVVPGLPKHRQSARRESDASDEHEDDDE